MDVPSTPNSEPPRHSVTSLDILKQKLYETQLQLKTQNSYISELESDLEHLRFIEDENTKMKSVISTKDLDLKQWTVKYSNMEFNFLELQKEHLVQIGALNKQLSILKNSKDTDENDLPVNLNDTLINELKTELDEKKKKYDEMQNIIKNQQTIIFKLESSKNKAIEELEDFKIQCCHKTEQLNECKQKIEELHEEYNMLRLKNNSLNNLNDHNERGNSLFAEVDDKRQAMMVELNKLQEKYEFLKTCFLKTSDDNIQMKMEIKRLLEPGDNDYLEKSYVVKAYENRISDLETRIRDLEKRPETPQVVQVGSESNIVLQIISNIRKEKKNLEDEMNRRSIRDMETRQQCFLKENEILQLRKEIRRDQIQLKELEQLVSLLKSELSSSKENITEDKLWTKEFYFHKNCKVNDGGLSMKPVKKIPQPAILNTFICPKLEEL